MKKKLSALVFRFIVWMLRVFYIHYEVVGIENLPDEPCIVAGNHVKMNGPIACELYFPVRRYTWCAGQMMHLKDVPDYAFQDFWSKKPKCIRWFYRLLSYAIAPLSVCLFTNANTIEVQRDMRVISTFRETVQRLQEDASVVIFPECYTPHNHIVHQFQEGFVDVARLYHRRTGRELSFVPMYIAPRLKKMYLGKPIRYCAENPLEQERKRICTYLMDEITSIACSLPRHIVVPYPNIPKRDYQYNIPAEVTANEKTGC